MVGCLLIAISREIAQDSHFNPLIKKDDLHFEDIEGITPDFICCKVVFTL